MAIARSAPTPDGRAPSAAPGTSAPSDVGGRCLVAVSTPPADGNALGRPIRVEVFGELCVETAPCLARALEDLTQTSATVEVDLSALTLCTSHGVDVLDRADRQLRAGGGELRIVGARGVVARVLAICGIPHHPVDPIASEADRGR